MGLSGNPKENLLLWEPLKEPLTDPLKHAFSGILEQPEKEHRFSYSQSKREPTPEDSSCGLSETETFATLRWWFQTLSSAWSRL